MSNLLKIDSPELNSVEKSKAEQIKATFEPMAKMLSNFENAYNEVLQEARKEITHDVTAKAKRLRIDIGRVRIETEKLRKEQKEEYLRAGKAIDGVSNILKWAVTDKENKLKEIENHFEIQEQKRLEALQLARAEKLALYVEDAHERNLAKFEDDEFEALLAIKKKEQEDRIAAEKKAEEERIAKEKAEAEERKRIRKENERLRKEAEEREEKERKQRSEYEAKLKAEREEKEKVQRELEAKAEAERQAKEAEKARIEAELSKGDADKVKDLIADLEKLKSKYSFKSAKNQKMYSEVSLLIDKLINHITK